MWELKADYLGGDDRYHPVDGGILTKEPHAVVFLRGPAGKRQAGPEHLLASIVDVRLGGLLMGRKKGLGVAFVAGAPGAVARAATKGRRDTLLQISVDEGGGRLDCRYAVERGRAEAWIRDAGLRTEAAAPPPARPQGERQQRSLLSRGRALFVKGPPPPSTP
jgi:hypothetical protein